MKSSNKYPNSQKSEIQHSNSLKGLIHIAKQRPKKSAVCIGDATRSLLRKHILYLIILQYMALLLDIKGTLNFSSISFSK